MSKSLEVLRMLRKIPKGKVTTYGALAKACRTSPRAVGQIMRHNEHPEIYSCYKVVSSSGKIHGYSGCLSGKNPARKTSFLKKDGIAIEKVKIDLQKYGHKFSA